MRGRSCTVEADPSCGVTSLNSPRAGRQQGQVGSGRCARGRLLGSFGRGGCVGRGGYCRGVPTALYRRYRPETFADVIGQVHVTEPLMQALRSDRVNHAYLFSGPRGCGKTTSARILARCLNCEQGPTPTPCGVCGSCVALARGGAGTVDVIEIDAASHGGVDDARELREKASFAPAESRHKIYIIDEAHMVSSQGFNALLKIVEEPPPHIKFIFATTEPEKVIGTIRSRTHHYPFRLVPPVVLQDYLAQLCELEQVSVDKGVLALVVRAGAGSVRDSLSVLDQLVAGSGSAGISYDRAVGLLGYTDATLLDDVVEAFAVGDAATVFRVVDRVIETGHEPRRFVEDLLERLRDLVIVAAVPDGAHAVLRGLPQDQLERMRQQSAHFGASALSRAADTVNAALTELTGATSPRLQLELLCARVLLPGAEGESGYGARLDRLERRLGAAAPAATPSPPPPPPSTGPAPAPPQPPAPADDGWPSATPPGRGSEQPRPVASGGPHPNDPPPATGERAPTSPLAHDHPTSGAAESAASGAIDVEAIRRAWPDVITRLSSMKKMTWSLVRDHAQVLAYDGRRLTLGLSTVGLTATFGGGAHGEYVRQALIDVLGVDAQVDGVHGRAAPTPPSVDASPARTDHQRQAPSATVPLDVQPIPPQDDEPPPPPDPQDFGPPARMMQPAVAVQPADDEAADDDVDVADSGLVGQPVVEQLLGGRVIDESDA